MNYTSKYASLRFPLDASVNLTALTLTDSNFNVMNNSFAAYQLKNMVDYDKSNYVTYP